MNEVLLNKLRALRESWVDLGDGKKLRIRRPPESSMVRFLNDYDIKIVCEYVVGWDGFTEADLLPGVGGSDPVLFDWNVCEEVLLDKSEWLNLVAASLMQSLSDCLNTKAAAAKN